MNKEYYREYYKKHKSKVNSYTAKWYAKNRQRMLNHNALKHRKKHSDVLSLLGGICVRCGESDWRCLQIDHIKGGGRKECRLFNNSWSMYSYYIKHPEESRKNLQVLCANCNWKKRYENKEGFKYK